VSVLSVLSCEVRNSSLSLSVATATTNFRRYLDLGRESNLDGGLDDAISG